MATQTYFNTATGINVRPTSSFLRVRVEDADCSSTTAFLKVPVDGQFIVAPSKTGDSVCRAATAVADTNKKFLSGTFTDLDLKAGPALAMVWLSQFKTDVDALGASKIPIVRGSLRFKTRYFISPSINVLTDFPAGTLLTVQAPTSDDAGGVVPSASGTYKRLALHPATGAGDSTSAWVVGFVTAIVSSDAGSEEIEVQLYEFPRLVTKA